MEDKSKLYCDVKLQYWVKNMQFCILFNVLYYALLTSFYKQTRRYGALLSQYDSYDFSLICIMSL